jgi:hypothetical protein
MVGVVGRERDELVTHGHDADWSAGPGWAAYRLVEAERVLGGGGSSTFGTVEETATQLVPGLGGRIWGKAVGGFVGIGSFDAGDPIESHLLPEGDVPEFAVDCVGDVG